MTLILFPKRARVFKDKFLNKYEKQWIMPMTNVIEHKRLEHEGAPLWIWLFGPLGFVLFLMSEFMSKKIEVSVFEVEKPNA